MSFKLAEKIQAFEGAALIWEAEAIFMSSLKILALPSNTLKILDWFY